MLDNFGKVSAGVGKVSDGLWKVSYGFWKVQDGLKNVSMVSYAVDGLAGLGKSEWWQLSLKTAKPKLESYLTIC